MTDAQKSIETEINNIVKLRISERMIDKWSSKRICNELNLRWQFFPEMKIFRIEHNCYSGVFKYILLTKNRQGYFDRESGYNLVYHLVKEKEDLLVLREDKYCGRRYSIFGKKISKQLISLIQKFKELEGAQ